MSLNTFKNAKQRIGADGQPKGTSRNMSAKPPHAASGQPKSGIIVQKPCYGANGQQGARATRSGVATRPVVAD